jgi:hypothetical protein
LKKASGTLRQPEVGHIAKDFARQSRLAPGSMSEKI